MPRAGHWTRDDQIEGLIRVADREPDIGFMVRLLALCTLPRTDPGTLTHYVRRNGRYALVVIAGGPEPRLPFGVLPRLLLAWICTEAVRTRSRRLVLGRSVAEFMRRLGVQSSDSAGRYGIRTRLREQMTRLFRASIELTEDLPDGVHTVADRVTTDMRLWWKPRRSDETVRWDSAIVLGHDFFNEILAAPVPIDMNVLRELRLQLPRSRPVPVADLQAVPTRPPALSHVAAGVPAVRAPPGAGAWPVRQGLPQGRASRAREDPDRLAPALVLDAEGAARAAPVASARPSGDFHGRAVNPGSFPA